MNILNHNAPTIIGIDHGFGNVKTAHTCFKSGVTAHGKEPTFKSDLLIYEGHYYTIGEEHKEFIPAIAAAMETMRQNIIVFNYNLSFVRDRRKDTKAYVEQVTRKYSDYKGLRSQMKVKAKENGELRKKLAGLPMFAASKRKELKTKIEELSKEIEELQFEVKYIMRTFEKADVTGMKEVEGEISKSKAHIVELDAWEVKYTDAINREKEKFIGLKAQAADLDQDELTDARLVLRPQMERDAQDRIRKSVQRVSFTKYQASVSDADKLLDGDGMTEQHRERERLTRIEER